MALTLKASVNTTITAEIDMSGLGAWQTCLADLEMKQLTLDT